MARNLAPLSGEASGWELKNLMFGAKKGYFFIFHKHKSSICYWDITIDFKCSYCYEPVPEYIKMQLKLLNGK